MKARLRFFSILLILSILSSFTVFAQESIDVVEAFRKNFTRGSLATKARVLQDSIDYKNSDMSELYLLSLNFVIDNSWMLVNDAQGRELVLFTVRLLGTTGVESSAGKLWTFFSEIEDNEIRVEIMNALGDTASGDKNIIIGINEWLRLQNSQYKSGKSVDEKLISETVATLGRIGDPSSFPVVFTTGTIGYSEDVNLSVSEALNGIDGYFTDHIIQVIKSSTSEEKLAALKAAFSQSNLTREDKASIAEVALDVGLYSDAKSPADEKNLRDLRFEAVRELTQLNWSGVSEGLIKHFDYTVFEFEQGVIRKVNLLEAIDALGSAGTHDAAVRLTLYLEVLNTYTENGQPVDEQIILGVIRNLGKLGDSTAFDYLLYTGYLNYSGTVQRAAREALKNLKSM